MGNTKFGKSPKWERQKEARSFRDGYETGLMVAVAVLRDVDGWDPERVQSFVHDCDELILCVNAEPGAWKNIKREIKRKTGLDFLYND